MAQAAVGGQAESREQQIFGEENSFSKARRLNDFEFNQFNDFPKLRSRRLIGEVEIPEVGTVGISIAQFCDSVDQRFNRRQSCEHDRDCCLVEDLIHPSAYHFFCCGRALIKDSMKFVQNNQPCLHGDQTLQDEPVQRRTAHLFKAATVLKTQFRQELYRQGFDGGLGRHFDKQAVFYAAVAAVSIVFCINIELPFDAFA